MKDKRNMIRRGMQMGLMAAMLSASPVFAQDPPAATLSIDTLPDDGVNVPSAPAVVPSAEQPIDNTALLAVAEAKRHVRDATVMPDTLTTLFFTAWQYALLQEAKIGFETGRPVEDIVTGTAEDSVSDIPPPPPEPGIRELALSGIAYSTSDRWTIWLNGMRITPGAVPPQIMDIKVSRTYIDLKWFDEYTNRIYPIRLRTQERFNLDSRLFLPGAGPL